jgi:hypothetical protein
MKVVYPEAENVSTFSAEPRGVARFIKRLGPQPLNPEQEAEGTQQIAAIVEEANKRLRSNQMHYRNGREAKPGDKTVKLNGGNIVAFGVLFDATPGNDYCNGSIAPIVNDQGACLCDMLHVDDLAAILKEKGLDKRPAGK